MKYPTIRIEGAILSADILDKIEQGELGGQLPKDFGFDAKIKVKDEIAKTWADAQDLWRILKRRTDSIPETATGTSETRKLWIIPLLELFGYDPELSKSEIVNGKTYAISHRALQLDGFPIHIMGFRDSLDKRCTEGGPRMSPHALVQEYINLTEHLFAIVTNGYQIRLLRDSSRLVKLSYIEFDMERMIEEEHFADFAILYRLLHASRMPVKQDAGPDSLIEKYHQDALDAGSRIRQGLSEAVKKSIVSLANGFLNHSDNGEFKERIAREQISDLQLYQFLLRLIYRLLFLLVIEERDLIFAKDVPAEKKRIYYDFYSVNRLRKLCEKRYLADAKNHDLWVALKQTFRLFETEQAGKPLGLKPLAGDLFGYDAIGELNKCNLDNKVLLECLKNLSVFTNKNTGHLMRVNYGALNVEEFGSVYEGLLEFEPATTRLNGKWKFDFKKGQERSASGSHYTPDELVQPLIKHSLDYVIADKLKEPDPQQALLAIKVCDVACGSGHILLNAARRIATELAKIRTGEDQPSPSAFREAVRDVIRSCIYGVDKNPLAVELCKVALWLEAHNPGEPLNFLDHHIKCGDAIVGLAHKEELERGIPNEAFKTLPGDDKEVAKSFSKRNREERNQWENTDGRVQISADFDERISTEITDLAKAHRNLAALPEGTPEQVAAKHEAYGRLTNKQSWWRLWTLANIQTAGFFIPKTLANKEKLVTDAEYREYLSGRPTQNVQSAFANTVANKRRFFHWFLEFPEVFENGGFDCILGNPPFLGGLKISTNLGGNYLSYLHSSFDAARGTCDMVAYFFRRDFELLKPDCFFGLIGTNTIGQGDTRTGGLEYINEHNGSFNFAVRSMRWPGQAAVEISLVTVFKGKWTGKLILNRRNVEQITSYLDDSESIGNPFVLSANSEKSFIGSYVLGKGFILEPEVAQQLIDQNPKNKDVLFRYLIGDDLNSHPSQSPRRWVINFQDWTEDFCRENYPDCFRIVEMLVKPERIKNNRKTRREKWWQFGDRAPKLYRTIARFDRLLVNSLVSKYCCFTWEPVSFVFSHRNGVFPISEKFGFTFLQSTLHTEWTWKYTSTLGSSTINYSPTDCFRTFPFPVLISQYQGKDLEEIGELYYQERKNIMVNLKLGLTKTYNLFHQPDLSVAAIKKASKQPTAVCEHSHADILKLRQLHKQMDEAVAAAYGWQDIDLAHDFYEVDYLPENDRIRYTISPQARKEVLKRLLKLNHEVHAREVAEGKLKKDNKKGKLKVKEASEQYKLDV